MESPADTPPAGRDSPSSTSSRQKRRAMGKTLKTRKTGRYSAGTKGKLSGVLSLPVEVFTEIASHLTPPDIIALSRSNKFFHGLLLDRSAAHIWGLALQNIPGLPPCPKDLREPQYAALIFSKHCSMCGAPVIKPMDPYLNVQLCNACRDNHLISMDEVPNHIRRFIPWTVRDHIDPGVCLRSEKEAMEAQYAEHLDTEGRGLGSPWVQERSAFCLERTEYAAKLTMFLVDMAESRMRELEDMKGQRREDIKRRLGDAGWEKSDWTFPWQVARKWATLVEGPKPLTDRVWKNLYPKLIPYLEKNRGFQTERFKNDRWRQRERRMRALLVATKKQNVMLKVDRKNIRGEVTIGPDNNPLAPFLDSDGEIPSEAEDDAGNTVIFVGHRESLNVTIERPFPPLVDALALPVISGLLEDDADADTLEDKFEESRGEIEEALRAWSRALEQDLVSLFKSGIDHNHSDDGNESTDSNSGVPPLELQFDLPPAYADFLNNLPSDTHLLLRADSVFRLIDDKASPPPLFYPEMFPILQVRTPGYFGRRLDHCLHKGPKLGHSWRTSDVAYYPEGVVAAKALLEQIGRPNAAQFELQALGPRFVCGLCPDKWVRTWNEIVHHYAEALVHARLAQERSSQAQSSILYNNLHFLNPNSRAKGKNKPLVIFYTRQEAEAIVSEQSKGRLSDQLLVQCNFCTELAISFLAPKDIMAKHIRAVHAIKAPKAEHRTKAYEVRGHIVIDTRGAKPRVSDSSSEEASVDEETWAERARDFGMAVYWSEWGTKGLDAYDD
ncbi:hypothetical protein FS749_005566 [Ceratobasidium sp. UAMH 11750]|nr:hypothetical protein FS749_005566 [Ceratobasidium sp. UAMH 11750]